MKPITGSIVALVTPMRDDGSVDYDALAPPDRLARRRRHAMHRRRRHDRRVADRHRRGALRDHPRRRRARARPRAGDGRHRRQLHRRGDRAFAFRAARSAPTARSRSCPTTTSRRRKASIATSRRSPRPSTSRWSLYNVPGRTVADMQPETVLRLAQVPGIIGIKEASGDIVRAAALIRDAPAGFSIYSGNDDSAIALMLLGGHGNVSVTANVAPRAMQALCTAAIAGNAREAARLHLQLLQPAQGPVRRAEPGADQVGARAARPLRRDGAPADHCRSAKRARPRSRRRCAKPASRRCGDPRSERPGTRGLSNARGAAVSAARPQLRWRLPE